MSTKKDKNTFDVNALLRYVSGESSLYEIVEMAEHSKDDTDFQEVVNLLETFRKQGLLDAPTGTPMESMAAAAEGNLCDIMCEQHILLDYYPDVNVSDTLGIALDNAWVKEAGTPLYNVGRLLEKHGWPVSRSYGRTLDEMAEELRCKRHVIAVVDSGSLWEGNENGLLHAVVVLSTGDGTVRIWDPATESNAAYSFREFEDAWGRSGRYLVVSSSEGMEYIPRPADVSKVDLDTDLLELGEAIAENVHDVWAKNRMDEGWKYGEHRDDARRFNPDLVPYSQLPENEKNYDRYTALDTLRLVKLLGFEIKRRPTEYCSACGTPVSLEFSYCPHCGEELKHWE